MTLRGLAERTAIGMLLLELMGVMEENGAPVSSSFWNCSIRRSNGVSNGTKTNRLRAFSMEKPGSPPVLQGSEKRRKSKSLRGGRH